MSDLDQVIDISQRLRELRDRLVELDRERVEVQREIDRHMSQLAATTGERHLPLRPDASMREQILAIFRRTPDRRISALDIDEAFAGRLAPADLANVRTLLSRMERERLLVRVRRGVYRLAT